MSVLQMIPNNTRATKESGVWRGCVIPLSVEAAVLTAQTQRTIQATASLGYFDIGLSGAERQIACMNTVLEHKILFLFCSFIE